MGSGCRAVRLRFDQEQWQLTGYLIYILEQAPCRHCDGQTMVCWRVEECYAHYNISEHDRLGNGVDLGDIFNDRHTCIHELSVRTMTVVTVLTYSDDIFRSFGHPRAETLGTSFLLINDTARFHTDSLHEVPPWWGHKCCRLSSSFSRHQLNHLPLDKMAAI